MIVGVPFGMHPRAIIPLFVAMCAVTIHARADDRSARTRGADPRAVKNRCIDASERGQVERDGAKLLAARASFVACSAAECPREVRTDCAGWLADVEARIPSVVISVTDDAGRDVADASVTLDGSPLQGALEGRAIPLDPGRRAFRFERAGSTPISVDVVLREGERRRKVDVRLPRAVVPVHRPIPPAFYGLGAASIAFGAAFVGLGVSAKNDADTLRSTCAPRCDPGDVDVARGKMIGANVALGAGIAALGAAIIVLVTRPSVPLRAAFHGARWEF